MRVTNLFLLVIAVISAVAIFLIPNETIAKDGTPIENSIESSNIKELDSRKFINVTSANKTLTVYEVYGSKVLVVETGDERIDVIKLD